MSTPDDQTQAPDIGAVPIDPAAERNTPPAAGSVTPQDEQKFYERAGEEYRLKHLQHNLGLLGRAFGNRESAPTNIVGLVVVVCLIFIGLSLFAPDNQSVGVVRTGLISLMSTALGYLFGAVKKD